jgi:hypothetical protein
VPEHVGPAAIHVQQRCVMSITEFVTDFLKSTDIRIEQQVSAMAWP